MLRRSEGCGVGDGGEVANDEGVERGIFFLFCGLPRAGKKGELN